jgi:hypothetical protein
VGRVVLLIGVSVMLWAVPSDANVGIEGWALRIAALATTIWLLAYLLRTPEEPSLSERLASIEPVCPFFGTPLLAGAGTRWSCPQCGAVRY